jgi:hypothetical protein
MQANIPSVMELNNPTSLGLHFTYNYELADAMMQTPDIYIQKVRFEIWPLTHVRVPGRAKRSGAGFNRDLRSIDHGRRLRFQTKEIMRWWLEGEKVDLTKDSEITLGKTQYASTSRSDAISQTYESRTTVDLLVSGSKRKAVFGKSRLKLIVLPSRNDPPAYFSCSYIGSQKSAELDASDSHI